MYLTIYQTTWSTGIGWVILNNLGLRANYPIPDFRNKQFIGGGFTDRVSANTGMAGSHSVLNITQCHAIILPQSGSIPLSAWPYTSHRKPRNDNAAPPLPEGRSRQPGDVLLIMGSGPVNQVIALACGATQR